MNIVNGIISLFEEFKIVGKFMVSSRVTLRSSKEVKKGIVSVILLEKPKSKLRKISFGGPAFHVRQVEEMVDTSLHAWENDGAELPESVLLPNGRSIKIEKVN